MCRVCLFVCLSNFFLSILGAFSEHLRRKKAFSIRFAIKRVQGSTFHNTACMLENWCQQRDNQTRQGGRAPLLGNNAPEKLEYSIRLTK